MTKAYIVHYCDEKFPHQDDTKWNNIIEEIRQIDPDKIIILSSSEVAVENIYQQFFDKIVPYLKETNKVVNVITPHKEQIIGNFHYEKTYGMIIPTLPNFLCSANKPYYWDFGSGSVPPYRENYQFPYLYSCYNVRVAEHRVRITEALARENLVDKGMLTFHLPEQVTWKYYDGKKRSDEATYSKDSADHFRFPASFQKCFVDIVCETWYEPKMFHATEKTLRSIAFFKPFLVLSCQGFYKDYLCKDFGIELYDEIFDYSFDDMEDLQDRVDAITENIKKISTIPRSQLSDLYIKLIPKMIRNKHRIIEILYNKDKIIPKSFRFMFNDNDVTLYGMTDNSLFGYMRTMGWCPPYKINRGV